MGYQRYRTGSGVEHTAHLDYLAGMVVDRAVGQLQLQLGEGGNGSLGAAVGLAQSQQLALRD